MNFEKQAKKLEEFLEEIFNKKVPVYLRKDGSLIYDDFIVKKNNNKWELQRAISSYVLDTFNLKSCAVAAAKLYRNNNFKKYNELKILDDYYQKHATDAEIFEHKYKKTKEDDLRDLFVARYVESKQRKLYAKDQITNKFKSLF